MERLPSPKNGAEEDAGERGQRTPEIVGGGGAAGGLSYHISAEGLKRSTVAWTNAFKSQASGSATSPGRTSTSGELRSPQASVHPRHQGQPRARLRVLVEAQAAEGDCDEGGRGRDSGQKESGRQTNRFLTWRWHVPVILRRSVFCKSES